MIELNLLKYLDLSFSEIYQIEHGEIEQKESIIETEIEKKEVGKKLPTSFLLLALALVIAIIIVVILYFAFFNKKDASPIKKTTVKKEKIHKKYNPEFNKKYKKIGSITFIDEPINTDNKTEKKSNKYDKPEIKKENIKVSPKKEIKKSNIVKPIKHKQNNKTSKTKPITYKYYASYENINKNELIYLKKKLKAKRLLYEVEKTKLIVKKYFYLYKQDKKGKKKIAERNVTFIKKFSNKNSALNYAKKYNIPAIILIKNEKERLYFIKVYPFSNQRNAINFVKKNKFKGKIVKIIKFTS
jgi:hypothetical protein